MDNKQKVIIRWFDFISTLILNNKFKEAQSVAEASKEYVKECWDDEKSWPSYEV